MNRRKAIEVIGKLIGMGLFSPSLAKEWLTSKQWSESPKTTQLETQWENIWENIQESILDYYRRNCEIQIKSINELYELLTSETSLSPFIDRNFIDRNSPRTILPPLTLFNFELHQTSKSKIDSSNTHDTKKFKEIIEKIKKQILESSEMQEYIKTLRSIEECILRARLKKALINTRSLPATRDQIARQHVQQFLETKELLSLALSSIQIIDYYSKGGKDYHIVEKTLDRYRAIIKKIEQVLRYSTLDKNRDHWSHPEQGVEQTSTQSVVLSKEQIEMVKLIETMIKEQFRSPVLQADRNKILFLVYHESGFNPQAHSSSTAVGLFQIVKSTWLKINHHLRCLANNQVAELRNDDPSHAQKWIDIRNQLPPSLLEEMRDNDYSNLDNRTDPRKNASFGLALYLAEGDGHWRFGDYERWLTPGNRGDQFTYKEKR